MYVCAQIRHEPVRHGNIGLSDGGRIKGVAKDGIRDTVVDRANFGKYLREQPTAGMINPDQPTQHGHSPARGAPARYDDVGPRFNHKKVRNNITIPAGTPSRGKLKFDWGNKGVGTYTYQQKEGETPATTSSRTWTRQAWSGGVGCARAKRSCSGKPDMPIRPTTPLASSGSTTGPRTTRRTWRFSQWRRTNGKKNATLHLEARVHFRKGEDGPG
jgi:hypothetical protein